MNQGNQAFGSEFIQEIAAARGAFADASVKGSTYLVFVDLNQRHKVLMVDCPFCP